MPPCTRTSSLTSAHGAFVEGPDGARTPRGSASAHASIDLRQHPLAVMCSLENTRGSCSSANSELGAPAVGDLGGCSDVPSIRDDTSVASAPSEICVSFPPSLCGYNSESTTLNPTPGSTTPTRHRHSASGSTKSRHSGSSHDPRFRRTRSSENNDIRSSLAHGRSSSKISEHNVMTLSSRIKENERAQQIKENPLLTLVTQSQEVQHQEAQNQHADFRSSRSTTFEVSKSVRSSSPSDSIAHRHNRRASPSDSKASASIPEPCASPGSSTESCLASPADSKVSPNHA